MSFSEEFDDRWFNVIEPTIREELRMEPNRVDYNTSGESIIHDILDGLAHSILILVDITSTQMRNENTHVVYPQRNANVFWELGIAHTMRLPDEVVVVKSDNDPSVFDLTQFRAFHYDPSRRIQAKSFIADILRDRLKVLDQLAGQYAINCLKSLTPFEFIFLSQVVAGSGDVEILSSPISAGNYRSLFDKNLLTWVIEMDMTSGQPGATKFIARATDFGRAVYNLVKQNKANSRMLLPDGLVVETIDGETKVFPKEK